VSSVRRFCPEIRVRHIDSLRPTQQTFDRGRETQPLRFSALVSARNLEHFRLADAAPDVRGWCVVSGDQRCVGTVTRLIVEMRTKRVRYLVIALDPSLERRRRASANSILLPVGLARPVDECCAIMLDRVHSEALQIAPRIPDRPINREDEERTLAVLGLPSLEESGGYEGQHFNELVLLGARH
jgi:hypothetical protein